MYDDLVSVIVPTYKRADLLKRSIDSVLAQTFDNFELIVVDDGEDEETRRLAVGYADDRIKYVSHEVNQGVCAARNTGIRISEGDLVCFLDDDDELTELYLEKVVLKMNKESLKTGFLWCSQIEVKYDEKGFEIGQKIRSVELEKDLDCTFILKIGAGGLCVRKSVIEECGGFDEGFELSEDRDLILSMLSRGYLCANLNYPLYKRYYHNRGRLSTSLDAKNMAIYDDRLLNKHRDFIDQHMGLKLRLLDLLAKHKYDSGDPRNAVDIAFEAWLVRPLRLRGMRRLFRYLCFNVFESIKSLAR